MALQRLISIITGLLFLFMTVAASHKIFKRQVSNSDSPSFSDSIRQTSGDLINHVSGGLSSQFSAFTFHPPNFAAVVALTPPPHSAAIILSGSNATRSSRILTDQSGNVSQSLQDRPELLLSQNSTSPFVSNETSNLNGSNLANGLPDLVPVQSNSPNSQIVNRTANATEVIILPVKVAESGLAEPFHVAQVQNGTSNNSSVFVESSAFAGPSNTSWAFVSIASPSSTAERTNTSAVIHTAETVTSASPSTPMAASDSSINGSQTVKLNGSVIALPGPVNETGSAKSAFLSGPEPNVVPSNSLAFAGNETITLPVEIVEPETASRVPDVGTTAVSRELTPAENITIVAPVLVSVENATVLYTSVPAEAATVPDSNTTSSTTSLSFVASDGPPNGTVLSLSWASALADHIDSAAAISGNHTTAMEDVGAAQLVPVNVSFENGLDLENATSSVVAEHEQNQNVSTDTPFLSPTATESLNENVTRSSDEVITINTTTVVPVNMSVDNGGTDNATVLTPVALQNLSNSTEASISAIFPKKDGVLAVSSGGAFTGHNLALGIGSNTEAPGNWTEGANLTDSETPVMVSVQPVLANVTLLTVNQSVAASVQLESNSTSVNVSEAEHLPINNLTSVGTTEEAPMLVELAPTADSTNKLAELTAGNLTSTGKLNEGDSTSGTITSASTTSNGTTTLSASNVSLAVSSNTTAGSELINSTTERNLTDRNPVQGASSVPRTEHSTRAPSPDSVTEVSVELNDTLTNQTFSDSNLTMFNMSNNKFFFNMLNHLEALNTFPPEWFVPTTSPKSTTKLMIFNLFPTGLENDTVLPANYTEDRPVLNENSTRPSFNATDLNFLNQSSHLALLNSTIHADWFATTSLPVSTTQTGVFSVPLNDTGNGSISSAVTPGEIGNTSIAQSISNSSGMPDNSSGLTVLNHSEIVSSAHPSVAALNNTELSANLSSSSGVSSEDLEHSRQNVTSFLAVSNSSDSFRNSSGLALDNFNATLGDSEVTHKDGNVNETIDTNSTRRVYNSTGLHFFNQLNHLEILNSTIPPEWFWNATAVPPRNATRLMIYNLFAENETISHLPANDSVAGNQSATSSQSPQANATLADSVNGTASATETVTSTIHPISSAAAGTSLETTTQLSGAANSTNGSSSMNETSSRSSVNFSASLIETGPGFNSSVTNSNETRPAVAIQISDGAANSSSVNTSSTFPNTTNVINSTDQVDEIDSSKVPRGSTAVLAVTSGINKDTNRTGAIAVNHTALDPDDSEKVELGNVELTNDTQPLVYHLPSAAQRNVSDNSSTSGSNASSSSQAATESRLQGYQVLNENNNSANISAKSPELHIGAVEVTPETQSSGLISSGNNLPTSPPSTTQLAAAETSSQGQSTSSTESSTNLSHSTHVQTSGTITRLMNTEMTPASTAATLTTGQPIQASKQGTTKNVAVSGVGAQRHPDVGVTQPSLLPVAGTGSLKGNSTVLTTVESPTTSTSDYQSGWSLPSFDDLGDSPVPLRILPLATRTASEGQLQILSAPTVKTLPKKATVTSPVALPDVPTSVPSERTSYVAEDPADEQKFLSLIPRPLNAQQVAKITLNPNREQQYPRFEQPPVTSFSCRNVSQPGYYADQETGCQEYHRCDISGSHFKFICPPTTLFSQLTLVCDYWYNVNCNEQVKHADYVNSRLYHGITYNRYFYAAPDRQTFSTLAVPSSATPMVENSTHADQQLEVKSMFILPAGRVRVSSAGFNSTLATVTVGSELRNAERGLPAVKSSGTVVPVGKPVLIFNSTALPGIEEPN